ncbi:MAG: endolytic transglycosylase MltG [Clostridia bacterium]|nr:endolytic transglycosylase MltG [Clostridia bacterium]
MTRRRKKKKSGKILLIIVIIALLFLLLGIGIKLYLSNAAEPFDENSEEMLTVTVESGSSTTGIANMLEENGIIGSASDFKLLSKLGGYDGRYKAGSYTLSPSMSANEIMELLISGNDVSMRVTIPEGYSIAQLAKKLEQENMINHDEFMNEIANGSFDYRFMSYLPQGENRLEGFLYPETYDFFTNATEYDIIDRMLKQFDSVFDNAAYARCEELGYSPYEVIIIASIIEKEAKVSTDRELISSVIYNRLGKGMPLQMCSTVLYALGDNKGYVTTKDTKYDSPYNTYMNKGLPPGPIASPGYGSIKAALYPADTDYIYFVVKPDGSGAHNFSSNYQQFEKDKAAYKASDVYPVN